MKITDCRKILIELSMEEIEILNLILTSNKDISYLKENEKIFLRNILTEIKNL